MITEYDYANVNSIVDHKHEGAGEIERAEELRLDLSDYDFKIIANRHIRNATAFWNKKDIKGIQSRNVKYWLGKQLDDAALYDWQTPYMQNVIFRNVETIISNSLVRIPTPVAIPSSGTIMSRNNAKALEHKLRKDIDSPKMRRKLRQALRHLMLMRIGAIKVRWDDNLLHGKGDYVFEVVHPDDLLVDATTAFDNNPKMVVHYLEETIKQVQAKFPHKKAEIWEKFNIKQGTESQLATTIRYEEIWFTWYDDDGLPVEGVGWKYNDLVLDIIKNPYYDYEGYGKGEDSTAREYKNYLEFPEKPFIFFNYLNLGKTLLDDTSLVDQNIVQQDNVNKRGRQITQQADTANGKWVFSSDAISKPEAEKVTDAPYEHIMVKGRATDGAIRISGQPPSETLFAALQSDISSMDSSFGTHGPIRGEAVSDTATTNILSKEGDVTRVDDLVAEAIEVGVSKIVEWSTHMIKMFYTEEHYVKDLGADGKLLHAALSSDVIEDGMEVSVKASTSNADMIRAEATELAKGGLIDPLTMFEDLDKDNPKERAKRVILYNADPIKYMEEILEMDTGDAGKIKQDIAMLKEGKIPDLPESVTEEYLAGLGDFLESDEFKEMNPQVQAIIFEYVQMLQEKAVADAQSGNVEGEDMREEVAPPEEPLPAAQSEELAQESEEPVGI